MEHKHPTISRENRVIHRRNEVFRTPAVQRSKGSIAKQLDQFQHTPHCEKRIVWC